MKRHEFDWRAVLGVLGGADLSAKASEPALWPTDEYREGYEQLISALLAPPGRLLVANLDLAIDRLFAELMKGEPASAAVKHRWEAAAVSLAEAKRQGQETRRTPSIFEAGG